MARPRRNSPALEVDVGPYEVDYTALILNVLKDWRVLVILAGFFSRRGPIALCRRRLPLRNSSAPGPEEAAAPSQGSIPPRRPRSTREANSRPGLALLLLSLDVPIDDSLDEAGLGCLALSAFSPLAREGIAVREIDLGRR